MAMTILIGTLPMKAGMTKVGDKTISNGSAYVPHLDRNHCPINSHMRLVRLWM